MISHSRLLYALLLSCASATAVYGEDYNPGDTFKDCDTCPEMVVIPAGKFIMGSAEGEGLDRERPEHEVTIARPFAVGKFEVTFAEWYACMNAGACKDRPRRKWWYERWPDFGVNWPVSDVSWDDSQEYLRWLSEKTGETYRLLTESEWEYAARAGNPGKWSFGDDEAQLGDYAWYAKNSTEGKPHPVGQKKPNAFGLHDMHGNVLEWVQDCHLGDYTYKPRDGSAHGSKVCDHVLRGGSWADVPGSLHAARRRWPDWLNYGTVGFRIARDLPPATTP